MQETETIGRVWGGNGKSASPGLELAEGDTSGSCRPLLAGKAKLLHPRVAQHIQELEFTSKPCHRLAQGIKQRHGA